MATVIERERAKEKALHDKLDAILEAVKKRNYEEAKKIVKTIPKQSAKKPAAKRTKKK